MIKNLPLYLLLLATVFLISMDEMSASTEHKGVLDRFEQNQAVILIEELNKEMIIPMSELPSGSIENTWFDIEINDGAIGNIQVDCRTTMEELERVRGLMRVLQEQIFIPEKVMDIRIKSTQLNLPKQW